MKFLRFLFANYCLKYSLITVIPRILVTNKVNFLTTVLPIWTSIDNLVWCAIGKKYKIITSYKWKHNGKLPHKSESAQCARTASNKQYAGDFPINLDQNWMKRIIFLNEESEKQKISHCEWRFGFSLMQSHQHIWNYD